MFKFLSMLAIALGISQPPSPDQPQKLSPGQHVIPIKDEHVTRIYYVYIPKVNNDKPLPVVMMLHGAGGNAQKTSMHYGWQEKAEKEKFIAIFPQGTPPNISEPATFKQNPNLWHSGYKISHNHMDDIKFLRDVLKDIEEKYPVDNKRIYVTGFSNGASMTFKMGIEMSDVITAIAPVAGHLYLKDPRPERTMSMMLIVGNKDPLNPINGGDATQPWGKTIVEKPPIFDTVVDWMKLLQINPTDKSMTNTPPVTTYHFGPNSEGKEIVYIVIDGQGHEWPGGVRTLPESITGPDIKSINATDVIWDFFKNKTL